MLKANILAVSTDYLSKETRTQFLPPFGYNQNTSSLSGTCKSITAEHQQGREMASRERLPAWCCAAPASQNVPLPPGLTLPWHRGAGTRAWCLRSPPRGRLPPQPAERSRQGKPPPGGSASPPTATAQRPQRPPRGPAGGSSARARGAPVRRGVKASGGEVVRSKTKSTLPGSSAQLAAPLFVFTSRAALYEKPPSSSGVQRERGRASAG